MFKSKSNTFFPCNTDSMLVYVKNSKFFRRIAKQRCFVVSCTVAVTQAKLQKTTVYKRADARNFYIATVKMFVAEMRLNEEVIALSCNADAMFENSRYLYCFKTSFCATYLHSPLVCFIGSVQ